MYFPIMGTRSVQRLTDREVPFQPKNILTEERWGEGKNNTEKKNLSSRGDIYIEVFVFFLPRPSYISGSYFGSNIGCFS